MMPWDMISGMARLPLKNQYCCVHKDGKELESTLEESHPICAKLSEERGMIKLS